MKIPLAVKALPSATLEASRLKNLRLQENKPVYNWGLGANPLLVPPVITDALSKNTHRKDYDLPGGIPKLADLIAKKESTNSYKVQRKNIIVAPGLKQILQDVQLAFGGPIIHIVPHWVSYSEQTNIHKKSFENSHQKRKQF